MAAAMKRSQSSCADMMCIDGTSHTGLVTLVILIRHEDGSSTLHKPLHVPDSCLKRGGGARFPFQAPEAGCALDGHTLVVASAHEAAVLELCIEAAAARDPPADRALDAGALPDLLALYRRAKRFDQAWLCACALQAIGCLGAAGMDIDAAASVLLELQPHRQGDDASVDAAREACEAGMLRAIGSLEELPGNEELLEKVLALPKPALDRILHARRTEAVYRLVGRGTERLIGGCTGVILDSMGDLVEVFNSQELRQQFVDLPLPAARALLSSDRLRVDSEDTVLTAATYYAVANGLQCFPASAFEIASCVRLSALSGNAFNVILPGLSWITGNGFFPHAAYGAISSQRQGGGRHRATLDHVGRLGLPDAWYASGARPATRHPGALEDADLTLRGLVSKLPALAAESECFYEVQDALFVQGIFLHVGLKLDARNDRLSVMLTGAMPEGSMAGAAVYRVDGTVTVSVCGPTPGEPAAQLAVEDCSGQLGAWRECGVLYRFGNGAHLYNVRDWAPLLTGDCVRLGVCAKPAAA